MGLFESLRARKAEKERIKRERQEELKKTKKYFEEHHPLIVKRGDFVDYLKSQEEENIFIDVFVVEMEYERYRIGMTLKKHPITQKCAYFCNDMLYATVDELIMYSPLCHKEREIILLGIETTEEKFVFDVDVRIDPKLEELAQKYGQMY